MGKSTNKCKTLMLLKQEYIKNLLEAFDRKLDRLQKRLSCDNLIIII